MANIRNRRAFFREKGIFCIEGGWANDHRDTTSVRKALEFLESIEKVKTIVKQCSHRDAFFDLISDSVQKKYNKYAILYIACHGAPAKLFVGKGSKNIVTLDEVRECLKGKANGRIIHFGSCSTLDISGWALRKFLRETEALAVSGFKKDVEFVSSAVLELLYFQQCQRSVDIHTIKNAMKKYSNNLGKELGFVLKTWN